MSITTNCPSNTTRKVGNNLTFTIKNMSGAPSGITYKINLMKRKYNSSTDTFFQVYPLIKHIYIKFRSPIEVNFIIK